MPGTTDTIKAKLTPGEFVIRKEAVDIVGSPLLNMINNLPKEGGHSSIDSIIDQETNSDMKMMYGGGMVKPNYAGGGMVQQYGHGGSVDKMMGYQEGGMANKFKPVPSNNPGLGKLPEMVRNRMGYMQNGGMVDNSLMGMMRGGMAKKKKMIGYQGGGETKKEQMIDYLVANPSLIREVDDFGYDTPDVGVDQSNQIPFSMSDLRRVDDLKGLFEAVDAEGRRYELSEKGLSAIGKKRKNPFKVTDMNTMKKGFVNTPKKEEQLVNLPTLLKMVRGQNIKDQERKEQENKKNNLGAYIFAAIAAGNAAKQLGLLKGFQGGGQVLEDDPLQIGRRMKMGSNAYPTGVGVARQSEDPLQVGMRMANPSIYGGQTLGVVRNQVDSLNKSIEQDIENKASKTLQLMKLKGILNEGVPIESSGEIEENVFPDRMQGKMKMSDRIKFMPFMPR